jgi:hypothetical protein
MLRPNDYVIPMYIGRTVTFLRSVLKNIIENPDGVIRCEFQYIVKAFNPDLMCRSSATVEKNTGISNQGRVMMKL